VGVLITAGQSNIASHVGTAPYSPSSPEVYNFNPHDARIYDLIDPVLGATSTLGLGSINGRIGDKLISRGVFSKVIICPMAVGGTPVAGWGAGNRIASVVRRLQAAQLPVSGVLWHQGESDTQAGTSQGSYQADLTTVLLGSINLGIAGPFFIAQNSYYEGATSSAVRAAQAAVCDGVTAILGPDTDVIDDTGRLEDDIHYNDAGAEDAAELWADVLEAHF
jgi:hypothetical protein